MPETPFELVWTPSQIDFYSGVFSLPGYTSS